MKKIIVYTALGFHAILFAPKTYSQVNPIPVLQFQDKESAGWAYKSDDQAFVAEKNGCKLQMNVSTPKEPGTQSVHIHRLNCEGKLELIPELVEVILPVMLKKFQPERLGTLMAGWCGEPRTQERVAVAAIEQTLAKPKSKASNGQKFHDAFVAGDAIREWRDLFLKYGLNVELDSVEKVLIMPFHKFTFAEKYPKYKDKKTKVPYSAMCWLKLSAAKKK